VELHAALSAAAEQQQVGERDSMVMVAAVLGELTRAWDTASFAHLAELLASRHG
jgi:hypothetical protein